MNGTCEMEDKDIAIITLFFLAIITFVLFSTVLIDHISMLTKAVLALGGQQ